MNLSRISLTLPASLLSLIIVIGAFSLLPLQASAQEGTPTSQESPSAVDQSQSQASTQSPSVVQQATQTQRSDHQKTNEIKPNNKDEFERVKEARLNELRYKHLWIAYSLVWLIIFMFIKRTWSRSQAVEQRLIELQSRVNQLE